MQDMKLEPQRAGRRVQVLRSGLGEIRIGLVDEQANDVCRRYQLVHQFQPLRPYLRVQRRYAPDVAARSGEARDKAKSDRLGRYLEYDRTRRGRCLARQCRRSATRRGNHGYLTTDEIGRQWPQSIVLAVRPAIFDRHVAAFDIAGFAQTL